MIPSGVAVEMPGGVWRNGARRRDARLRPLDGSQAVAFAEGPREAPVIFATRLLAHCLVELAGEAPVTEDMVRKLTLGDREALLLHVQMTSYGDRIDLFVDCPSCHARLDLSIRSRDMLVAPYRSAPAVRRRSTSIEGTQHRLRFRLPTGEDIEHAIQGVDEFAGDRLVLDRCTLDVDPPLERGVLAELMDELLEKLDPQSELRFNLTCPECETRFSTVLDMATHLWRKARAQARLVFWEVHAIASAYHWSEADILALLPDRRRRYLELIDIAGAAG